MLKYPYTTNGNHKSFNAARKANTEAVLRALERTSEFEPARLSMADRVPYIMLQPCLSNRKEYKIVLFDGKGAPNPLICILHFLMSSYVLRISSGWQFQQLSKERESVW